MSENAKRFDMALILRRRMLEIILVLMIVVFSLLNSHFLTARNWVNIVRNISVYGIIGLGMCMLFASGGIDLSVGSTSGLATVLVATTCELFQDAGQSITVGAIVGIFVALIAALLVGAFIAFFVTRFGMPPFIVTLACNYTVSGIAGIISGGYPKVVVPAWFNNLASYQLFGFVPTSAVAFIVLAIIFYIIMNQTETGRSIYAVGGNAEAARLSGINVTKYRYIASMTVQFTGALAGIMLCSQVMAGNATYGSEWSMQCIAAVLIGGSSLDGGGGSIWGTVIGLIFLGAILNFMTLMNMSEFVQDVVNGILILVAVLVNISDIGNKLKGMKRKKRAA